jgi:UPF0716 family protein affecting phage T7 exclusion
MPTKEVTDGALILFGGALLLTPGFVSDIIGMLLLFPPTRALIKRAFRRTLGSWARRRYVPPGVGAIYETTVVGQRRSDAKTSLRSGEDDSPDKG